MGITLSGGYLHGYLNGTQYPFYFNGYTTSQTYSKAQVDSLINALKNKISTLENNGGGIKTQLLGQNGYIEFTNGIIMQWGLHSGGTLTFSKAFPHACYSLIATGYATGELFENGVQILHVRSLSRTGATFHGAVNDNDGGTGYNAASSGLHFWFAIGY